ncbi:FkbM family methyltransferase [Psychromonas sp. SR45-3]|uniref:FkbM family methyltransferase n=1 Tax=Psychromonas sp. SR45-3 TaxID=2760930 RepID=UPI0015FB77ED|nr:FkbM family methyltransferase [Psychromonas sp. SR45-3]MBB1271633.1 FkbM family methyltransferase [Psychromonas sp. SR45-3]
MLKSKEVIIFGTGGMLNIAISELTNMGISVKYLCDNNESIQGSYINNLKVLKPDDLTAKSLPVLITSMYSKDIGKQLAKLHVLEFYDFSYAFDYKRWHGHFDLNRINNAEEEINQALEILDDEQSKEVFLSLIHFRKTKNPTSIQPAEFPDYFHPKVSPQKNDTIIDGGAWYGDSSLDFNNRLSTQCKILAFEPDIENFKKLQKTIITKNMSASVTPVNAGLYNKKTSLYFKKEAENDMQFQVQSEISEHKIEVVSIDTFAQEKQLENIDFIKMDIEGSEIMALKGAVNTIIKDKPRLAICIYHEFDDLWKIPLLVKQLNPNYQLYLGHHSQNLFETVLYAI